MEKKKDKTIAERFIFAISWFSKKKIFFKPKIETAPKIGKEIKKDIFAASTLLKFKNLDCEYYL